MKENCNQLAEADNADKGNRFCSPLDCLFSLNPIQFSLLSSIIGILVIDNLDLNQQNSLGNFLVGVGQNILTAAAQGAMLESKNEKNDQIRDQIQMLKKQICVLEQDLD
ncbi:MAG: hypothetical protein Q8942_04940 [Bacillota bacterium]|nr:hypothetical protein [Bacillota bacterium]